MSSFCLQCHVKSQSAAMPPLERGLEVVRPATVEVAASKLASLTCQGRQAASPNVTHFPSSSCPSLQGSRSSWLICFPQADVSGEARMFSDVGGGGDHFQTLMFLVTSFILEELSQSTIFHGKVWSLQACAPNQIYELVDLLTLI